MMSLLKSQVSYGKMLLQAAALDIEIELLLAAKLDPEEVMCSLDMVEKEEDPKWPTTDDGIGLWFFENQETGRKSLVEGTTLDRFEATFRSMHRNALTVNAVCDLIRAAFESHRIRVDSIDPITQDGDQIGEFVATVHIGDYAAQEQIFSAIDMARSVLPAVIDLRLNVLFPSSITNLEING